MEFIPRDILEYCSVNKLAPPIQGCREYKQGDTLPNGRILDQGVKGSGKCLWLTFKE